MSVAATSTRHKTIMDEIAKKQGSYTTKMPNDSAKDLAAMQETIDKQEKMLWSTIITLAKNQIIDSEKGGLDASAMMQATSTSAQFKMQKMSIEESLKVADMMKDAALATTSQMVGKKVSLDDGVRNFSGSPIKFNYEILGKSIPPNAIIQTQISVATKEGKEIFSKTQRSDKIGKNSFNWDGKDKDGEIADEGNYRINVSATYSVPGNNSKPITLATTTVKTGIIEEVEVNNDKKLSLIIDGQRFDMASLKGLSINDKTEIEESKGPISEYIGYIGKTVEIEQNKVNFTGKKTNISFISNNAQRDTTIKIKFTDNVGKTAAVAEKKQDITIGQNSFSWDGWDTKSIDEFKKMKNNEINVSYLPTDVYTYEVTVISTDDKGEITETILPNTGKYTIDSIDKSNGKIVLGANNFKFDVTDVKKVIEKPAAPSSYNQLLQEGADLINKRAIFPDTLYYDGKNKTTMLFDIPDLPAGSTLGNARIKISDQNRTVIAEITKQAADIYTKSIGAVIPNAGHLNADSKKDVKNFFYNRFPESDWGAPTEGEQIAIDKYIEHGFRSGQLFQDTYDGLSDEAKLEQRYKNMGAIPFAWDGMNNAHALQPAGNYSYSIEYNVTDNTGQNTTETLSQLNTGVIAATQVENNETILVIYDSYNQEFHIPLNKIERIA